MLDVTLLGCGGMMPLRDRALTALLVSANGHSVLIDCGEGTQVRLRASGQSFKRIDAILLTHYHGDHIFGIPGLLLSMSNSERTEPLVIAGPPGLERLIAAFRAMMPQLPFDLMIRELSLTDPRPFPAACFSVSYCPLVHGVPCVGYRIDMKRAGRFLPEKALAAGVPLKLWSILQKQGEAEWEGVTYRADMVMTPDRRGLSVVYATDTRPTEALESLAREADLLVTESMYGDPEKRGNALEKGHMMMTEAAELAAKAQAKRLWLTHYSPALADPDEWLPEARKLFPGVCPGSDGLHTELFFDRDELT